MNISSYCCDAAAFDSDTTATANTTTIEPMIVPHPNNADALVGNVMIQGRPNLQAILFKKLAWPAVSGGWVSSKKTQRKYWRIFLKMTSCLPCRRSCTFIVILSIC